jgi:hypothetical protein
MMCDTCMVWRNICLMMFEDEKECGICSKNFQTDSEADVVTT